MLTVLGRATSVNVQIVMFAVAELGLPFDRQDFGHVHGGVDTPEFLAKNPNGRVPVLIDGDLVMFESCAIARYLAAQYGSDAFWPKDTKARARIDVWAEWGKTSLYEGFTAPIFWPGVRLAAKDRDEAAFAASLKRFDGLLAILEAQIGDQPFICGGDFTLADIVNGSILFRYFDMDIPRRDRPVLRSYYDRLCVRPAYRDHVMVSYDSLRAGA
ncbi:MAG: glutathione S-transferase family protein [Rhodobacterales bacterium]